MVQNKDAVKKFGLVGAIVTISVAMLPGWSKQGDTGSVKAAAATVEPKRNTFEPLSNLAAFKGKAPEEFLSDASVGPKLRTILPQEQIACAKEIFNYMPDLELKPDGSVHAELMGSHAEGWRHGLINVHPSGEINLLLDCNFDGKGKQPYYLFTNRNIEINSAKVISDWIAETPLNGDEMVVVSDGLTKRETLLQQLTRKAGNVVAKNLADQKSTSDETSSTKGKEKVVSEAAPIKQSNNNSASNATNSQSQRRIAYIRAGAIACGNPGSFLKIAAIERVNNPYVSLPGDCETAPADIPTTFIRYIRTPTASDLIQAGTLVGTFYVRNYDIVY